MIAHVPQLTNLFGGQIGLGKGLKGAPDNSKSFFNTMRGLLSGGRDSGHLKLGSLCKLNSANGAHFHSLNRVSDGSGHIISKKDLLVGLKQLMNSKGLSFIKNLKTFLEKSGVNLNLVQLNENQLNDITNLLGQFGFNKKKLNKILMDLLKSPSSGEGATLADVFDQLSKMDFKEIANSGIQIEISNIAFLNSTLTLMGLSDAQVDQVLDGSINADKQIDIGIVLSNLKDFGQKNPELLDKLPSHQKMSQIHQLMSQLAVNIQKHTNKVQMGQEMPTNLGKLIAFLEAQNPQAEHSSAKEQIKGLQAFLENMEGDVSAKSLIQKLGETVELISHESTNLQGHLDKNNNGTKIKVDPSVKAADVTDVSGIAGGTMDMDENPVIKNKRLYNPELTKNNGLLSKNFKAAVAEMNPIAQVNANSITNAKQNVKAKKMTEDALQTGLKQATKNMGPLANSHLGKIVSNSNRENNKGIKTGRKNLHETVAQIQDRIIEKSAEIVSNKKDTAGALKGKTFRNNVEAADLNEAPKSNKAFQDHSINPTNAKTDKNEAFANIKKQAETPKPVPSYVLEQVSRKLVKSIQNGNHELQLQLKPPHLGKLQVRIDTHETGVKVSIIAEQYNAKDILLSHSHELKALLHDQGIRLEKLDIQLGQNFDQNMANTKQQSNKSGQKRRSGMTINNPEIAGITKDQNESIQSRNSKGDLDLVA